MVVKARRSATLQATASAQPISFMYLGLFCFRWAFFALSSSAVTIATRGFEWRARLQQTELVSVKARGWEKVGLRLLHNVEREQQLSFIQCRGAHLGYYKSTQRVSQGRWCHVRTHRRSRSLSAKAQTLHASTIWEMRLHRLTQHCQARHSRKIRPRLQLCGSKSALSSRTRLMAASPRTWRASNRQLLR